VIARSDARRHFEGVAEFVAAALSAVAVGTVVSPSRGLRWRLLTRAFGDPRRGDGAHLGMITAAHAPVLGMLITLSPNW
jgi:hypothetical protein